MAKLEPACCGQNLGFLMGKKRVCLCFARDLGRRLKIVPGSNAAYPADGARPGHGKGDEGHLAHWGPLAERVTSSSNVHSSLAAKSLLQLQKEREMEGSSSMCLMGHAFLERRRIKPCLMSPGKMPNPYKNPKCLSLQRSAASFSLQTKTLQASAPSLRSGGDLKPGPTVEVSREMGNLS